MSENVTLRPKQRKAIAALAGGADYTRAAAEAGVSVRTLKRWRADPLFMAELRDTDSEQLASTARLLNAASRNAVAVLITVLNDEKAPIGLRMRAASDLLKHRASFFELLTLEQRVTALEAQIAR